LNIRNIKIEDWERLKEMLVVMTQEKPPVAIELEALVLRTKEWIKKFPTEGQGIFSVAINKEKIIGLCYLIIPKFYKPIAYIGIAIQKDYRKNGTGSQLFYHVAEWAVSQRLQYIIADVWSWNKNSIGFFYSLGFEEKSRFMDKFKGKEKEKIRLVKKI
jgi:RimJ/RimL family protein N-acetyltransferase